MPQLQVPPQPHSASLAIAKTATQNGGFGPAPRMKTTIHTTGGGSKSLGGNLSGRLAERDPDDDGHHRGQHGASMVTTGKSEGRSGSRALRPVPQVFALLGVPGPTEIGIGAHALARARDHHDRATTLECPVMAHYQGAASGWLRSCRPCYLSRAAVRPKKARTGRLTRLPCLGSPFRIRGCAQRRSSTTRLSTANWGSSQLRSV